MSEESTNILDKWLISRIQTLKTNVAAEMEKYRLYNVVPELFIFIEDLTNWYIRLNRTRFWGSGLGEDKISAFSTLYVVLVDLCKLMAPFTPFLSDYLYQKLSSFKEQDQAASVHLCQYPEAEVGFVNMRLELAVDRMQQVILLGRQRREEVKVGLRTPLKKMIIINKNQELLSDMRSLEGYLKEELNVQEIDYRADEENFIESKARPNFPVLGKRLGKKMKGFASKISSLNFNEIKKLMSEEKIEIEVDNNVEIFTTDEIDILQEGKQNSNTISNRKISIDLDCTLTPELKRAGYAREFVNRIQRLRKDRDFEVSDRIALTYKAEEVLSAAIEEHLNYIMNETLSKSVKFEKNLNGVVTEIDDLALEFEIKQLNS